ncbi:MAG: histidine triad nucleotide-binding protein [Clostridiales bacterium]|jgi:diadenosine tetraphosphate (Ap4A) HIT family hydrolase|nr:histidine triad nucleotide-binding protein [Clostridiales bacterium]
MENCIFCKIIGGVIPSERLYEDDKMIIIKDIAPKAETHLLMIPKKHYSDITGLDVTTASELGECLLKLQEISRKLGFSDGFRLIINKGEKAGQTVFHLHIHILAGDNLTGF